ncbi:MAG: DUF4129 domain-containing protein [Actinomycetota bacterium]|nr:DUF4129 domain-containing protein [Actinomycetota bacterium]
MDGPSRDDASEAGRRRPLGAAAAPVLIVLFLAVVAIVSAGRRAGGGAGGRGPSHAFYEYALSTLMVGWAVGAMVLLYVVLRGRLLKRKELRPAWNFRGARLIAYLLVFLVVLFLLREPLQRLRARFAANPAAQPGERGGGGSGVTDPQQLEFRWAPVFVALVLGLLLLGLVVTAILRRRALKKAPRTVEQALAQVMDDALDDIRHERDARKAIIAAYARLEKLLAGFGRARDPSEAPFEFLARVLIELRVSRYPVEALTELFERAKFSTHSLGGEDKARAIEALETVRDELRDPVAVASEQAPVPA